MKIRYVLKNRAEDYDIEKRLIRWLFTEHPLDHTKVIVLPCIGDALRRWVESRQVRESVLPKLYEQLTGRASNVESP